VKRSIIGASGGRQGAAVASVSGALDRDLSDEVSRTIALRVQAGLLSLEISPDAPTFVPASHVPAMSMSEMTWRAYGTEGLLLLGTDVCVPAPIVSDANIRLRAIVAAALGLSPHTPGSVIVDDLRDYEFCASVNDLVGLCLRLGLEHLECGDRTIDVHATGMDARLSPGVDHIAVDSDSCLITFKRYRPPISLTSDDAALVKAVQRVQSVRVMDSDALDRLRRLDALGILRLSP
jgi:hypothetical protein